MGAWHLTRVPLCFRTSGSATRQNGDYLRDPPPCVAKRASPLGGARSLFGQWLYLGLAGDSAPFLPQRAQPATPKKPRIQVVILTKTGLQKESDKTQP